MNALALFALAYTGLSAMSQSMARHHAAVVAYRVPRSPQLRIALRLGAAACLLAALAIAMHQAGSAQGVLLCIGALTVTAPAVMLQLAYAPRTLRISTVAACVAGLLSTLPAILH
ncbi:hypothetical protein GCM10027277_20710 [Pseudoduganella ginsengisoli]|uniref:DUF3325 family protein n=1 Tax=Pseudoduganella ginsengisoli TaxID=1462440 RepID=A0A6L6PUA4_9BURK|nr:DUF3325 domain-containing protein [Pseudoduganella ginsengisoli]MTW00674.1 DUF3325 family protein [Pseudoduganella ginsengisoli]